VKPLRAPAAIVVGGCLGGALAEGLANGAHAWIVAGETSATGPTAAAVDEGFSWLLGACGGIVAGCAVALVLVRRADPLVAVGSSVIGVAVLCGALRLQGDHVGLADFGAGAVAAGIASAFVLAAAVLVLALRGRLM
jgi:hypothetical protein